MSHVPRALVLGRDGQVGFEVCRILDGRGAEYVGLGRKECDLSVSGAASQVVERLKPQVIINAAAYTAVDKAENEPALARQVNGVSVGELAEAAKGIGALLVHYSTDYVFNGEKDGPWVEEDATAPLNEYGRSKRTGEELVLASGAAAFIFRTSWVYGARGSNFLWTMLKLGAEREELKVISDQIGAPTWSRNLAELAVYVMDRFATSNGSIDDDAASKAAGIYHATCGGSTSWHGFAEAIFEEARAAGAELRVKEIKKISSDEWPSPARRPKNSVLSNQKLKTNLGYELPHWRDALRAVVTEVTAG